MVIGQPNLSRMIIKDPGRLRYTCVKYKCPQKSAHRDSKLPYCIQAWKLAPRDEEMWHSLRFWPNMFWYICPGTLSSPSLTGCQHCFAARSLHAEHRKKRNLKCIRSCLVGILRSHAIWLKHRFSISWSSGVALEGEHGFEEWSIMSLLAPYSIREQIRCSTFTSSQIAPLGILHDS